MLFFMLALSVAQTVLNALTIVQFFWMLISWDRSHPLARFGAQLAEWIADVVRFQTGATDERPMPWSDWPAANRSHPADPAI